MSNKEENKTRDFLVELSSLMERYNATVHFTVDDDFLAEIKAYTDLDGEVIIRSDHISEGDYFDISHNELDKIFEDDMYRIAEEYLKDIDTLKLRGE